MGNYGQLNFMGNHGQLWATMGNYGLMPTGRDYPSCLSLSLPRARALAARDTSNRPRFVHAPGSDQHQPQEGTHNPAKGRPKWCFRLEPVCKWVLQFRHRFTTGRGVILTDLQSSMIVNKLLSLALSLSHIHTLKRH